MRLAKRVEKLPPYLFVEISRKIAEKKARGEEVISFAIGDPDIPTPKHVVDRLCEAARDPANHRYPVLRRRKTIPRNTQMHTDATEDARVVEAAGATFQGSMEEGARRSFLSGEWDALGVLLGNPAEVEATRARLPYIGGFTGE